MSIINIRALAQLSQIWIKWYKRILRTQIQRIINSPIHLSHFPRRMEKTLQDIAQQDARTKSDTHSLDGIHDRPDYVWACLETVGPDEVHEMHHGIFAPQPSDT